MKKPFPGWNLTFVGAMYTPSVFRYLFIILSNSLKTFRRSFLSSPKLEIFASSRFGPGINSLTEYGHFRGSKKPISSIGTIINFGLLIYKDKLVQKFVIF